MLTMFSKRHTPIGIDFGDNYLAAAQWKRNDGSLFVSNYTVFEGIQEQALPYHKNRDCKDGVLRILKKIREKGFSGRPVVFTLHSSQIYLRPLTLPVMEIDELGEAVYWEMHQYLVNELLKDHVIDYITVREKIAEGCPALEVLAAAVSKTVVEDHFDLLCEAGYEPLAMEIRQQPLFRLLHFIKERTIDSDENECYIVLDIGEEESFLLFADAERILFARSVAMGRRVLAKGLESQTVGGGVLAGNRYNGAVVAIDLNVISAEKLLQEIERAVEHFTYHMGNRDKVLSYLYITGQGKYIQGLSSYLSKGLQLHLLAGEGLSSYFKPEGNKKNSAQERELFLASVAAGASLRVQAS